MSSVIPAEDDDFERDHKKPKRIGQDFEIVRSEGGDWMLKIKHGERSCFTSASMEEVALWLSREGMYKILKDIYQLALAGEAEAIAQLIEGSKLDQSKIRHG